MSETSTAQFAKLLNETHPGLRVQLVEISTTGDIEADKALKSFGGVGVFTKQLETALLEERIDLEEARTALADAKKKGTVSWKKIKADLGL